jgi:N-acetyl-gamma-glutamyl-phosphate reductase
MNATVALIGARGYTGAEFLKLLARHPALTLAFASSGSHAGQQIQAQVPDWPDARDRFCQLAPEDLAAHEADAWLLAVPNGTAAKWAGAIRAKYDRAIIIDLSADHRFEPGWAYGLPEHHRAAIGKSRNIANPGCYATGAQLALLPLRERLADVPVVLACQATAGRAEPHPSAMTPIACATI